MKSLSRFFSQHRFLIVDESSVSRIAIVRTFSELGLPTSRMSLANSFQSARDLISQNQFTGLITEYDLGPNCGLELLDLIPNLSISVVVTKNQSEVAAARSAERDVDAFIKKPFTAASFKGAVLDLIQKKISVQQRSVSRELLPLTGSIEQAQASLEGLKQSDKMGYRSLIGLYEALLSQGQKQDAYEVLRRLVMGFPLNPQRLLEILRLAIETRNLQDIDDYYAAFLRIDDKGEEMVKNICAALILSGKQMIRSGEPEKAIDTFKKAVLTSGKRAGFLKTIVLALLDGDLPNEADWFLTCYPAESRQSVDFLGLDYLVFSRLRPVHEVLQRGRELLRKNQSDPLIYRILIQACLQAGHSSEAESLAMDASRHWPSSSGDYRALLQVIDRDALGPA